MSTNNSPIKLFTVTEAAQLLRCHPKSLRRRILAGLVVATKPRGAQRWLIPEHELRRQLEQGASTQ